MKIVVDTETTGFPVKNRDKTIPNPSNYAAYDNARLVELAYIVLDDDNTEVKRFSSLIRGGSDEGHSIKNSHIHGITDKMCLEEGADLVKVLSTFYSDCRLCNTFISHNAEFDLSIILAECYRIAANNQIEPISSLITKLTKMKVFCTMKEATKHFDLEKYPKLIELFTYFFPERKFIPHRALEDSIAARDCYIELSSAINTSQTLSTSSNSRP